MWTAREKTFLNFVKDLMRYLLAFLSSNYLSNSQSYVFMNSVAYLGSENSRSLSEVWNPHHVCRQGKSHFGTGDLHQQVRLPKISWHYLSDWQDWCHLKLTTSYFPLTLPSSLHKGVFRGRGKGDICAILVSHQQIMLMGDIVTSFWENIFSKLFDMKYTLQNRHIEFWISLTFPYHPLVDPWWDRQGKNGHDLNRQVEITFLTLPQCILMRSCLT